MAEFVYIGSFPPPYGGVTVKNALLYEALSKHVNIERIDLSVVKKGSIAYTMKLLKAVFGRKGALVIGASADLRYLITTTMHLFNKGKMRKSILIVMGGAVPDGKAYVKRLGQYKRIYVETEGMRRLFENMGVENVSVYPNCRLRPLIPCKIRKTCQEESG